MHWPLTLQDAEIAYHRGTAQGGLLAEFGPLVAAYPPATLPELVDTGWFDGSRPPALEEWEGFESFCAAHGLPCLVRVQSVGLPLLLPDLTERGYRLDYLLHAYMQALPELRGDEQPRIPSGIEVQETADREGWAQVAAAGFGPGTEEVMGLVGRQAGRLFWARRVGMGEWAASAAYTVSGGVATVRPRSQQSAGRACKRRCWRRGCGQSRPRAQGRSGPMCTSSQEAAVSATCSGRASGWWERSWPSPNPLTLPR